MYESPSAGAQEGDEAEHQNAFETKGPMEVRIHHHPFGPTGEEKIPRYPGFTPGRRGPRVIQ